MRERFQWQDAHFGEKDLEDPLQTLILPTLLGYGNTLQLGCLLGHIANFFKCNNLFTGDSGERKPLSSVTVAFVEEMSCFYSQKMYINSPPCLQAVLTNL